MSGGQSSLMLCARVQESNKVRVVKDNLVSCYGLGNKLVMSYRLGGGNPVSCCGIKGESNPMMRAQCAWIVLYCCMGYFGGNA